MMKGQVAIDSGGADGIGYAELGGRDRLRSPLLLFRFKIVVVGRLVDKEGYFLYVLGFDVMLFNQL